MRYIRWRKAVRDLISNKSRTFLVSMSIAIGIFGVGIILNGYSILTREMKSNYIGTNPASFTLYTNSANDSKIANKINALPGIKEVERRKTVLARIMDKDKEWKTIFLYVVEDFNNVHVNTFKLELGKKVPSKNEILIERDDLKVLKSNVGDSVNIKIPGASFKTLNIVGRVHAPGLAPASMEHFAYGFVSKDALKWLGDDLNFNELRVVVSKNQFNENHIRNIAANTKKWCIQKGYKIDGIDIPKPGQHPHAGQLLSFIFLLQACALLSLIMSSVLVVNMISAMLAGQVRQIGIMKAIGAKKSQIEGLYVGIIAVLGIVASIIAIPIAAYVGKGYAEFAAAILNFNIIDSTIPLWSFLVQFILGLAIPLLATAYPIIKAGKISVKDAINDYGVGKVKPNKSTSNIKLFWRPLMLSIRNSLRKKGRTLFTIATLAISGAIFVTAFNILASLDNTVNVNFNAIKYDAEIRLTKAYPIEQIEKVMNKIEGTKNTEYWGYGDVRIQKGNVTEGKEFLLKAPTKNSKMLKLPMLEGRWLKESNSNEIVINHILADEEKQLKVGAKVDIVVDSKIRSVKVIGIAKEVAGRPAMYINYKDFINFAGEKGFTKYLLIKLNSKKVVNQNKIIASIEDNFTRSNIDILDSWKTTYFREAFLGHLKIVIISLIIIAFFTVIIGGMGLASTMAINVMDRMREIGIMRSIGASNKEVYKIIIGESFFIGIISWLAGIIISIPFTFLIGNIFGSIFMKTNINTTVSLFGILIWLIVSFIIIIIASYFPANKAVNISVHEVLTYD
jgi:putative ABC transport system permease protein